MKLAVISGSRADEAALKAVTNACQKEGIDVHWFTLPCAVLGVPTRLEVATETASACQDAAHFLNGKNFDLVLLHGDRYEILGAATGAFMLGLPIVHLGGGDVTLGSQDDAIRNSITQLSSLHLVSNKDSGLRLESMGCNPERIFVTGDPALDTIRPTLSKKEIIDLLGLSDDYFIIAYHPDTRYNQTHYEVSHLVLAFEALYLNNPKVSFLFLGPNKDYGHEIIEDAFKLLGKWSRCHYITHLERSHYLSALDSALALVGNSSAAYYEAPSLGTPVIIYGKRQLGRRLGKNPIIMAKNSTELTWAMQTVLNTRPPRIKGNPYGDGKACERIVAIFKDLKPSKLLYKRFREC